MDEKRQYLEAATSLGRISALIPSQPVKRLTKADLAFIDAAIQMHRASRAPISEGPGIEVGNPAACDTVDLTAALVAVAVFAYHAYNSCMIGEDLSSVRSIQLGYKAQLVPEVSLDKLIDARNQLAAALKAAE